jgi:hypothetical protein
MLAAIARSVIGPLPVARDAWVPPFLVPRRC